MYVFPSHSYKNGLDHGNSFQPKYIYRYSSSATTNGTPIGFLFSFSIIQCIYSTLVCMYAHIYIYIAYIYINIYIQIYIYTNITEQTMVFHFNQYTCTDSLFDTASGTPVGFSFQFFFQIFTLYKTFIICSNISSAIFLHYTYISYT